MGYPIKKYKMSVADMMRYRRFIKAFERDVPKMQKEFIKRSLAYIRISATRILNESYISVNYWYDRTYNLNNSWQETYVSYLSGKLENLAPYSAFVEFGTGIIGDVTNESNFPQDLGYEYDVDSPHKDDDGSWNFIYDEGTSENNGFHNTIGQQGYAYMYGAVYQDYLLRGVYKKIFKGVIYEWLTKHKNL